MPPGGGGELALGLQTGRWRKEEGKARVLPQTWEAVGGPCPKIIPQREGLCMRVAHWAESTKWGAVVMWGEGIGPFEGRGHHELDGLRHRDTPRGEPGVDGQGQGGRGTHKEGSASPSQIWYLPRCLIESENQDPRGVFVKGRCFYFPFWLPLSSHPPPGKGGVLYLVPTPQPPKGGNYLGGGTFFWEDA